MNYPKFRVMTVVALKTSPLRRLFGVECKKSKEDRRYWPLCGEDGRLLLFTERLKAQAWIKTNRDAEVVTCNQVVVGGCVDDFIRE